MFKHQISHFGRIKQLQSSMTSRRGSFSKLTQNPRWKEFKDQNPHHLVFNYLSMVIDTKKNARLPPDLQVTANGTSLQRHASWNHWNSYQQTIETTCLCHVNVDLLHRNVRMTSRFGGQRCPFVSWPSPNPPLGYRHITALGNSLGLNGMAPLHFFHLSCKTVAKRNGHLQTLLLQYLKYDARVF